VGLPCLPVLPHKRLIGVVLGGFAAHMLQIALCALAIIALVRWAGLGTLGASANPGWATAMYFSAETFTSLGYGDVLPDGPLRLLAGVEALNGWLLIRWSASYLFVSMARFWGLLPLRGEPMQTSKPGQPGEPAQTGLRTPFSSLKRKAGSPGPSGKHRP